MGYTSTPRRFLFVAGTVIRHGLAHALDRRWPRLAARCSRWLPQPGLPGPERLRVGLEELGGTFIKLGQMLALQPDIVPLEYCNALFKLLDKVDPFGWPEVERIVEEELGRSPDEIFESIEREPLATASVGQVHVAWLDGQKVAVKVQRPSVETEFWSDIRLMEGLLSTIEKFHISPLYWMLEPMGEFVTWTREELDYRHEARCSETLRKRAEGRVGQHVPKVFEHLTTRRTLVVEFLDGVTLLDCLRAADQQDEVLLARLTARGFDRHQAASNLIDNFLSNAFEYGIYHADLHPANLMVLDDSVIGYIDFGITGVMNEYARRHLMKMTFALTRGDMDLFHEEFLRVTSWGKESDLPGFRSGLESIASDWYEEGPEGPRLVANFTRVMTEMLQLSRRTQVMPERNVIKYIRSSIAIDGLVSRFDPSFDLGTYLADRCTKFLQWQKRSQWLEADRFLDWTGAAAQLLHDGPSRGARAVDRLVSGELPVELDLGQRKGPEQRAKAIQLACTVAGSAALVAVTPEPALGANLLTAALLIAAWASIALLGTLRRLA
ncbi:MAG: phosphotransferase [Deltaproteobacteria bacterium]|nr:phosphotransferase [Deltaproteobacteria bacterium]